MPKICIVADIHFGVPGRTDDILWSCKVIREYCNTFGIDVVVILGDLYHNRQSIEIDINSKVYRFFEQCNEQYKQQWVVFPGNHDMFLRHSWEINSLTPLRKHLHVIEDICVLDIQGSRFWVVPFITYEKSYMKVIKSIVKHPEFRQGDSLFTHIGVRSATMNTCFLIKDWSIVSFEGLPFHRVYTGHFHSRQQIGENVWYPGSPIPFKFDEGDVPHGFYVLDTEADTHKFINIWKAGHKFFPQEPQPPQYTTIPDTDLANIPNDQIKNSIVRVALNREYTTDEKNQIKNKLMSSGAASVRWLDLYNKKTVEQQNGLKPTVVNSDMFAAWVKDDSKNLQDLDIKVLTRCNQEVVHEGDELYSLESSEDPS